jgi:hypothetical protein
MRRWRTILFDGVERHLFTLDLFHMHYLVGEIACEAITDDLVCCCFCLVPGTGTNAPASSCFIPIVPPVYLCAENHSGREGYADKNAQLNSRHMRDEPP